MTAVEVESTRPRAGAEDTGRPSRAGMWVALVALAAVPALVKLLVAASYPGSDDAFIHLRVIDLLASQGVWGVNPGDAVNLSSSPLFTLVLWAMHGIGLGGVGPAQVLTATFTTLALVLVGAALTHITRTRALVLAGVALAAFNVNLWRWNGTVMEATFACLIVAAALWWRYRLVARNAPVSAELVLGLLVGLGVLVRFELFLLLLCLAVDLLLQQRGRRGLVALLVGAGIPMLAWAIAASAMFSDPLPTTFYAKASGWHLINAEVTRQFLEVMVSSCGIPLLVAGVAIIVIAKREGQAGLAGFLRGHLTLVAFPLAMFAFYYLRTPTLQSAGRYLLPATFLPAMLAVAAIDRAWRTGGASSPRRSWPSPTMLGIAAAAQAALCVILFATSVVPVLRGFNGGYRETMREVAGFLKEHCEPGDVTLIRIDIGVVSYEQDGACTLADGGALASPELRGLDVEQQIRRTHPRFVVESLGRSRGDLGRRVDGLRLLWSRRFTGHGLSGRDHYVANIYAVER